jgi:Ca2+-transporting ATPase
MTVLVGAGNTTLLLVKGAPEEVLPACASTLTPDGTSAGLDRARIEQILTAVDDMASSGMRILGLARRELDSPVSDLISEEKHMTLVGLAVLRDPVRPEAARSVKEARAAGVDIVMVTGDHSGTAVAVAEEVGLAGPGPTVRTGRDLRDGNQADHLLTTRVYARVEPEQKLSLVEALQAQGHVVAVTGDGVNDAPALRRANIGVAMGRSGSDVAREAADMVVVDDNLATIITAIREGRGIYDNIRKVVDYLVGGNLSEIMVVVASLALFPALGIPLLPIQLLWINLLTDGLPALALGVDPVDPSLMRRMPRPSGEGLLTRARVALLMGRASLIAGASVGSLAVSRFVLNEPWDHARAVMFTVLVIAHLLYAFVVRGRAVAANRWLVLAVATGLALQAAVIIWPSARPIFGTASLAPEEILLAACAGTAPVALMLLSDRRKEGR